MCVYVLEIILTELVWSVQRFRMPCCEDLVAWRPKVSGQGRKDASMFVQVLVTYLLTSSGALRYVPDYLLRPKMAFYLVNRLKAFWLSPSFPVNFNKCPQPDIGAVPIPKPDYDKVTWQLEGMFPVHTLVFLPIWHSVAWVQCWLISYFQVTSTMPSTIRFHGDNPVSPLFIPQVIFITAHKS